MTVARSNISTVLKLKKVAQQEGLYEENEHLIKFKSNNKQIIHVTPTLTLICTTPNNLILAKLFQFSYTLKNGSTKL